MCGLIERLDRDHVPSIQCTVDLQLYPFYCLFVCLLFSMASADHSSTWVHYTGEPIGPIGANRSDGHRVKLFEESVTFIAQLHPEVIFLKDDA